MKILILGVKGMLGQELKHAFLGAEVLAWDFEELDITNEIEVKEKIREQKPDVVINAAAYNNVDKAEIEKNKAVLLNGYALGYIAKACKEAGAIFIHYSTDYVFDGKRKEGYKEMDIPKPVSAYGASKLLGEIETAKNTDKYYIIRLSRLFGKTGDGISVKKSFVDTMLDLAKSKNEIEVIDEELSSPTYAPDLAERTKYIVESKQPFGIYHSAGSGACTWYEFASEIFKQKGADIKVVPVSGDKFPRNALRPKYSVLLNTKLPPMRDWKEVLSNYLAT
ncbi:dTDP-4-dehydrorhamnose reductase [Candidatus Parcubacteria bacterium]|nr:dTDP-4-dehydrorhamnose reductase [Patescibacteria group bacterium]MCG2693930.1 dTDP-4-dehydrorhamnose reductase [Candidatus Parcubacteria bacterium]